MICIILSETLNVTKYFNPGIKNAFYTYISYGTPCPVIQVSMSTSKINIEPFDQVSWCLDLVGLSMSFPVSSQLILKLSRTLLALWVMILGAITLLCTPIINNITKIILAIVKNGWLHRLCVNDTSGVFGSVSQCHAPTAVHTEMTPNSILHRRVAGCRLAITSVRRLSKAFKSSHTVWSKDIFLLSPCVDPG